MKPFELPGRFMKRSAILFSLVSGDHLVSGRFFVCCQIITTMSLGRYNFIC
jgi:hypothetical protein